MSAARIDRRLDVLIDPGRPSHRQAVKRCCVEKLQGSCVVFYLSNKYTVELSFSDVASWPGGRLDAWPARVHVVDAIAEAGCYPDQESYPSCLEAKNSCSLFVCLSPVSSPFRARL